MIYAEPMKGSSLVKARSLYLLAPLLALVTAAFTTAFSTTHSPRTIPGHVWGVSPDVRTTAQPPAAPTLQYARYFFSTDNVNSPATQASRWPLLIGQGNQQAAAKRVKAADPAHVRTVVYADPLFIRTTDPDGVTTTTDNAKTTANHPEWILRDSTGAWVKAKNFANQDYAADIGNSGYQRASITFLLNKIKADGWNGVFLDDTNPTPTFTFATRPVKYPTDAAWQRAELVYVRTVCGAIRSAGYLCYLNLGQQNTTWAQSVAKLSNGPMTEFFVAMNPAVTGGPALATIENGLWISQLTWAQWAETNTTQQIVHASTTDPAAIDYALTSFLLVSEGSGSFAANRSYTSTSEGSTFTTAMTNARKLGAPTGDAVADGSGVYYRNFAHGRVVVNPHSSARTFGGRMYPATTGSVTLS